MKFKFLLSTALITTLVACGGAEERKTVYMEKAKASIEAGDLDKARILLKNVLQIDPKDGEAYFQLGGVFERQKEYRKAYANYLKTEELSPDLLENHAKLGRFYLIYMNDTAKAQEKVDLILSKEPDNADGLLLKAVVMYREDKKEAAVRIVKNMLVTNPNHIEGVAFLVALYGKDNKLKEAIKLLDAALKDNKNNEQLNKLLAVALLSNKEYKRAEVIYKDFLKRNPDNKTSYNNLAAFYNQSGNKAKAEETLRASVENDKSDVERQLILVNYINDEKNTSDAIAELKKLIASQQGAGKLRTALIELYLRENDKKSAIEVCNQAITDFSDEETGTSARIALASIHISDKNYDKASDIIESAMLTSPNNPSVNFLRAKLALREKDTEKAIISLRIVNKEKPENIEAYILLASVYKFEKNNEQVNSVLNAAYDNNKSNADSLLKLAQYQLTRDVNQASKIIDSYNSLKQDDYDGLSIKASILNQNKQYSEAYKIAEKLMEMYSDKPNGYLQAVPYYTEQSDFKKAAAILEKGYISTEDNRKVLLVLTTLQLQDKKYDIVEKRIKAEISSAPDDLEFKILLAKVYMLSDKISQAEITLNEVIAINPGLEEPYLLFSHIYERSKNLDAVKSILVRGVVGVPSSTKIPLRLADIYEQDGEYNKAIDVYYNYNQSKPENLIVINNMASLLSTYVDGQAGLELAAELIKKLEGTDQAAFLDTIGWVYYKLGDADKAVENLQKVVLKQPDVSVFNYHLGMAYILANDKTQAKFYLQKSLANKKDFKEKADAEEALKNL